MVVTATWLFIKCANLARNTLTFPQLIKYHLPMRSLSSIATPGLELTFEKFEEKEIALVQMTNGDNRLSPQYIDNIDDLLSEVESNKSCQALITTGEGKFYSNGLDQEHVATLDSEGLKQYLNHFSRLAIRLLVFPMITVSAINGHAFAGGAILALSHDLRAMRSDRGWLSCNEIFVGIRFNEVLLELLRNKIPTNHQSQFVVFGKRFTAPEALHAGLVDHVTGQETLLEDSKRLVTQVLGSQTFDREELKTFKKDLYKPVLDVFPQAKQSV